jgi:hypothetical protein
MPTATTQAPTLTLQERYNLGLMLGLAQKFGHQPEAIGPHCWKIASRSEPGTFRTVTQEGTRLRCDCPSGRLCSHTAAVHLLLCQQRRVKPLAVPTAPEVLRLDRAPEARNALALIQRPRDTKPQAPTQPTQPQPTPATPPRSTPPPVATEAQLRDAARRRESALLVRDEGDFSIFKSERR